MPDEPRWLTPEKEQLWRRWLRLKAALPAALHRELQAEADLSLPDFDVLVQLTDSPERREECRADGRGAWVLSPAEVAVMTAVGDKVLTRPESMDMPTCA